MCDTDDIKGESRLAFEDYITRKGNFLVLSDTEDMAELSCYDLIIDAILGTGLKGSPRGFSAVIIDEINKTDVPVLSVDTPSGLDNDTGIAGTSCIRATVTVTMGFPKIGLCFYPGKEYVGKLVVCDLGYPDEIISENSSNLFIPSKLTIEKLLPSRHPGGSKIDHGLAMLVCGSRGMCGSATLASEAALRCGCGMTHLVAPKSSVDILSVKLTETVIHSVNETESGTIDFSALEQVKKLAHKKNA
ncbi:MAG: NAD(P)H-hydrate epimerase, partial [Fibrobacter sp.]|nr:NAD(P)H-hydrate epimerase [Fibrobacter sp.]